MKSKLLGALGALWVLIGLRFACWAVQERPPASNQGRAILTCRIVCTSHAENPGRDSSFNEQVKATLTETETYRLKRASPTSPDFTMSLVSCQLQVTAEGKGEWVAKDQPTRRWTYGAVQPKGRHFVNLEEVFHSNNEYRASVTDFVQDSCKKAPESELMGGMAPGMVVAAFMLSQRPGGPLEYRFKMPRLKMATTLSAHRTLTNDIPPKDPVKGSATIEVDYQLRIIPPGASLPPPVAGPKVELQEIDRNWLPEEDNSLTATMRVNRDKEASSFRFTLYDVSKEPGVCGNGRDKNADPDLKFAEDSGDWSIKQSGNQWIATSDSEGKEAEIEILCRDWGAWGKLKAEAKIDDKWEPAKVAGSGLNYVRIPYDDDDDHIADSWQAENNVAGKAATDDDDDDQPAGQNVTGDGMSVYVEYRGFEILEGDKRVHKRMVPLRRELFVIDESGIFDTAVWERASGIPAYRLAPDMARAMAGPEAAHLVTFRSSYARKGDKYALVLHAVTGSGGEDPAELNGATNWPVKSPRDEVYCRVYVDRIRSMIGALATKLGIAAAQPDSAEAKEFAKLGLPPWMLKNASDKLSGAYREQLAQQVIRLSAIHEVGHACGLPGHSPGGANAVEVPVGNVKCPMRYADTAMGLRYMVLQVLLKPSAPLPMDYAAFCRDSDFNCFGHLNLKDY